MELTWSFLNSEINLSHQTWEEVAHYSLKYPSCSFLSVLLAQLFDAHVAGLDDVLQVSRALFIFLYSFLHAPQRGLS